MARGPMRQVCQTCRDGDDFVTWEVEGPGLWRYSCASPVHGESGYSWLSTGRSPLDGAGHDGLSEELGIYDALLRCLTPGETYIEYGIVEYRYAVANPGEYKHLVKLYDHTQAALDRGEGLEYSASAFIGGALGRLYHRDGLLTRVDTKATGFWSYNGTLHGWALKPGPDNDTVRTWADFAAKQGLKPKEWPKELLT
ncbi:MAG: hypothetical protein ACT4OV_07185 [Microthrixaceae bacterium]